MTEEITDEPAAAALIDEARKAAHNAHAPYSDFRVGAVAVDAAGNHHVGVNLENAAYGSTTCAEANAIAAAAATGARHITTVAVVCLDGADCHPCGNCRQVMREFNVDEVIVEDRDGRHIIMSLEALLPKSFGPESLQDRK